MAENTLMLDSLRTSFPMFFFLSSTRLLATHNGTSTLTLRSGICWINF